MAANHENCGGSLLTGWGGNTGQDEYTYCDKCRAFVFGDDDMPPGGVPEWRNREAWDNGDERSPDPDYETERSISAEGDLREDWSSRRYRNP